MVVSWRANKFLLPQIDSKLLCSGCAASAATHHNEVVYAELQTMSCYDRTQWDARPCQPRMNSSWHGEVSVGHALTLFSEHQRLATTQLPLQRAHIMNYASIASMQHLILSGLCIASYNQGILGMLSETLKEFCNLKFLPCMSYDLIKIYWTVPQISLGRILAASLAKFDRPTLPWPIVVTFVQCWTYCIKRQVSYCIWYTVFHASISAILTESHSSVPKPPEHNKKAEV